MASKHSKIVITGAAGLTGQNLIVELKSQGFTQLVAIDKHAHNLDILRQLHPEAASVEADVAVPGEWEDQFAGASCVVQLHAQITSKFPEEFVRNNIDATRVVLDAIKGTKFPTWCTSAPRWSRRSPTTTIRTRRRRRRSSLLSPVSVIACYVPR
jgi:nucleoside-diphosphate-sugar epimerase